MPAVDDLLILAVVSGLPAGPEYTHMSKRLQNLAKSAAITL